MKKITPLKAVALGFVLALFVELLLAANLTTYVGRYYGDGAGLTNVPAAAIVASATITNAILQWQMDATFEDKLYRLGTHGIELDYERIDLGSATALLRTVDGTLHFPTSPFIDGAQFLGTALGVDPNTGQLIPIDGTVPVNNFFITNLWVTNITAQTINVSGKATFNNIVVTNQLQFTTNAFPLAAGTSWNLTKPRQFIITNADWVIGSLGGLTNNADNWGTIYWSNSAAATHFCDLTALSVTPIGPNSTNKVYAGAGKVAVISIDSYGVGVLTNLCTQVQP